MAEQDDQKRLQTLMLQIRSYQSALQEIARQNALAESSIMELMGTIHALKELPKSKEEEALIPIGARVYTKAKLLDKKRVVVFVGGDIHVEKTAPEAVKYLEKKKDELAANDSKLKEQAQRLNAELEQANQAAEELYLKLQGK